MSTKNRDKVKKEPSRNRQMHVIMYMFVLLFLSMMGYFVYYIQFNSPEDVNNSYNTRQETLAAKVVRGKILSADGDVLAETLTSSDGKESRHYPYGEDFAHIVGYSTRGKSGIESLANISLLTSNADIGERISNEISESKNMGDNIVTTLDVRLQQTAAETLGIYKGAIVAIEPKSGRILAMYSNPGFDPNTIAMQWDELSEKKAESPLINRATQGLYPPGSTFKIVTLLEFYREYKDQVDSYSYGCNGRFTYDGVTVNCYHGANHGQVNLRQSFAKSCNSSFANIGSELSAKAFNNTAAELLFNEKLPLKLAYNSSKFNYEKESDVEQRLHTAIGQGKTLISPFHLCLITSAIANDGMLMRPMIIERLENYQGTVIKQYKPQNYKRMMTEDEAEFLTLYMNAVVQEGTGSKLSGLDYTVAGKTGSAEFGSTKGESHAWFTGFSNIDNPELAVTVIVEGAGSGSDYAVPMAKRMFDAYYDKY